MGIRRAVYLLLLTKLAATQTDVTLDLIQGTITGVLDECHNVELYRGVPIAKPPVGIHYEQFLQICKSIK